jgi:hypothetical protein
MEKIHNAVGLDFGFFERADRFEVFGLVVVLRKRVAGKRSWEQYDTQLSMARF